MDLGLDWIWIKLMDYVHSQGSSMAPIPSITSGEVIPFSTVAILNQSKPYLIGLLKSITTTKVRKSAYSVASSARIFVCAIFSNKARYRDSA